MLCCLACMDVSDVVGYKVEPKYNHGTRQDEEVYKTKWKEIRNEPWF